MRPGGHADLRAFIAVSELGSFARAAEQLGISPSFLSQTIRTLEERLGVRLLHRTTRSVSLTEAGEQFLGRIRPALEELDAAVAALGHYRDRPAGTVRVRALRQVYRAYLAPMLASFHAAYPDVVLDILVDDAIVDFVAEGFDVGFTLGEILDKELVAIRIGGEMRQIAVASPDYVARLGRPETPADLRAHKCLRWRWAGRSLPYQWEFHEDGKWFEVDVRGPLILSEHRMTIDAALEGIGIAFWIESELRPLIEAGKLVPLLENWSAPYPGFYLCYPRQRQMSPALRSFIDAVKAKAEKG